MYLENTPKVVDLTTWQAAHRPGFFGSRRAQIETDLDARCGSQGWTLGWLVGQSFLNYPAAVRLYEDAYVAFLVGRADLLQRLCAYSDVYDNSPTNVECGLDYVHEEIRRTRSNHIQDIALRWAMMRLGQQFNPAGRMLEVRGYKSEGADYSPGVVPFHAPHLTPQPEIRPKWARSGSVEAFWQSAKYLMILKSLLD